MLAILRSRERKGRPSFWERPSRALPDREETRREGDASRPRLAGGVNRLVKYADIDARKESRHDVRGETMWRALRSLALIIGNHEDFRELTRGVAMAFGWLIVSAILVLIAAIIVSALF
jgi:hypothetical protein